ncbi:MAG: hypothetical protein EBT03_11075 [Betaproteobacteria bacterium]|nr:hypothetical protein [Betaproteobacteria bacterium]
MKEAAMKANAEQSRLLAHRLKQEGASPKTLNALADHLETMWRAGYNQMPMVNAIRRTLDEAEA